MIGQGFVEVVAEVPAQREAVGHDAHELALGAQVLKEHHKLELEEHYRVYRGASHPGVQSAHQIPDEGEIQRAL
jgi:hypothetical protein